MSKLKYISVQCFILLFIISCSQDVDSQEKEELQKSKKVENTITVTEKQFKNSDFQLSTIKVKTFNKSLPVNGNTHLPEMNKVIVSSLLGGRVSPFDLIHGQKVKKGQFLFSLSNPDLIDWQEEYLVLQSELAFQEGEFNRQKLLAAENIAAKKNYNQAESALRITKAKLSGLGEKLKLNGINPQDIVESDFESKLNIYAPSKGYITEISIKQGMYLEKFQEAIEISNTDHIHMELKVLEKDIFKIRNGQKVRYSLQDAPDKEMEAEIYLVEQDVDENSMLNIHCHISEEEEKRLLPGMFVRANIILDAYEAKAVEEEAIVSLGDKKYLLELRSGSKYEFEKREVEIGICQDGFCEITSIDHEEEDFSILSKGAYYIFLDEEG